MKDPPCATGDFADIEPVRFAIDKGRLYGIAEILDASELRAYACDVRKLSECIDAAAIPARRGTTESAVDKERLYDIAAALEAEDFPACGRDVRRVADYIESIRQQRSH